MKNKKEKILVAMSGGVDSSVVAALLVDSGHDVTGAYMINYDSHDDGKFSNDSKEERCWVGDYRDATRVAAKLGIPLLKLDFKKEYEETVLKYMFDEYKKGRTPNPDVMCNRWVKFGFWLDKVRELGFDKMATGHYAKVAEDYKLLQAKDENKDQTYFLHQLNQKQLSQTLFPLCDYTKDEVRELAKKFDLPTAEKEESMGICFVGEVDMKEFLQKKIKLKKGNVIMSSGEKIGEHDGLAFYTMGQRHLGVQSNNTKSLFVVEKRFETNELVVGYDDDLLLFKGEIEVEDVNWIAGQAPDMPLKCDVRLRHRQELQSAQVDKFTSTKGGYVIRFEKEQRAVASGQFCVFYSPRDEVLRGMKGECLGGGVIK